MAKPRRTKRQLRTKYHLFGVVTVCEAYHCLLEHQANGVNVFQAHLRLIISNDPLLQHTHVMLLEDALPQSKPFEPPCFRYCKLSLTPHIEAIFLDPSGHISYVLSVRPGQGIMRVDDQSQGSKR